MEIYIVTMLDGTTIEVPRNEMDEFMKENHENIRGIDKKGEK